MYLWWQPVQAPLDTLPFPSLALGPGKTPFCLLLSLLLFRDIYALNNLKNTKIISGCVFQTFSHSLNVLITVCFASFWCKVCWKWVGVKRTEACSCHMLTEQEEFNLKTTLFIYFSVCASLLLFPRTEKNINNAFFDGLFLVKISIWIPPLKTNRGDAPLFLFLL